jgi:predicted SAM-dependent methyltransferase
LPDELVDYIYSSHCLEHVDNWIETLEYWIKNLKDGGILFLYLPDFSQKYWRP